MIKYAQHGPEIIQNEYPTLPFYTLTYNCRLQFVIPNLFSQLWRAKFDPHDRKFLNNDHISGNTTRRQGIYRCGKNTTVSIESRHFALILARERTCAFYERRNTLLRCLVYNEPFQKTWELCILQRFQGRPFTLSCKQICYSPSRTSTDCHPHSNTVGVGGTSLRLGELG